MERVGRISVPWLIVTLVLGLTGVARTAYGYGYGVGKDPFIEAFKAINKALNATPANWKEVENQFGTVRTVVEKMDKDYKADLLGRIESAIQAGAQGTDPAQQSKTLVAGFHKTFVYLVKHKLENAETNLQKFSTAKALVTEAKQYYDVLAPLVKKAGPGDDTGIRKAFEAAMKALGNPGAFGMGAKPPDPGEFKAQASAIEETLKKHF